MGGSNTTPPGGGLPGQYGTSGVAAAGNIPGSRQNAATWTDSEGNLWLFGGGGIDSTSRYGFLNDLWKLNTSSVQWTWVGGSSAIPSGLPTSGQFPGQPGMYGTLGVFAAGNIPGGRSGAVSWTDSSGHLWLFGGEGVDSTSQYGYLNDLWEFNPSSNQWAWMSGSSTVGGQVATHGSLGVFATGNTPGGLSGAVSWIDSQGHLWLFSGVGRDSNGEEVYFNDLWEFDASTIEWAWLGGSTQGMKCPLAVPCTPGVYGTLGVFAPGNIPGGRYGAVNWTDSKGHLWLLGGFGWDSVGLRGFFNDLWEFDASTMEWAWMAGSSTVGGSVPSPLDPNQGQPGVYGTLGVPAPGNTPGGRSNSSTWTDSNGNFWLFGGAFASTGSPDIPIYFNDVWEFNSATMEWAWMGGSSALPPFVESLSGNGFPGVYGTLGVPAAGNLPGSRASASNWPQSDGTIWIFGGSGMDSIGNGGILNDIWQWGGLSSTSPPTFTFAASNVSMTIKSGQLGTNTLTVTPQNGFNSAVTFACSGLPAGASCSFSPPTVTPSGSAVATTLTLTAQTLVAESDSRRGLHTPGAALALSLCFFAFRKRRRLVFLALFAIAFTAIGLMSACGSSSSTSKTPTPMTSTVTVTATSGAIQQTATISLTVN